MIFDRTVESQCTNATGYSRRFEVLCTLRDNSWNFKEASFDLSSTEITEKGFTQISSDEEYANSEEKEEWNKLIETLQEDKDKSLLFKSHSLLTSAQPRYNFGSIVKYMKNSGIGRPSTYSYIVNILLKHGYVSKIKEKLAPTITSLFIIQAFQLSIVHYLKSNFTAEMEDALDEITNNSTDLDRWLNNIYKESDHSILQLYEKILSIEKERVRSVKLDEMEIYISPNGSLSVSIDGDQERVPVINMPLNELTREAVERIKVDRKFMRNLGKVGNYDATVRKSHYGYYVMLKRSDKKERPRFYAIPKELSPYDCQLVELLKKNDKLKIFYDELEKKASSHNSVN
jgi:hypothetical protein